MEKSREETLKALQRELQEACTSYIEACRLPSQQSARDLAFAKMVGTMKQLKAFKPKAGS